MCSRIILGLILCLSVVQYSWANSLGVVLLDEIILDKLMSRFAVSLVKFDVAYPYGDKHENYAKFAKEQNVLVEDMLIGDVHAKDYGDKENWGLLKRFGINEKELPTILLFKKSDPTKWIKYPRDNEVTVDNLKNFVRRNTKLYIGLSGCIQEFDTIAAAFMEKFNRNEFGDLDRLIGEATNLMERQLDEQKEKMANVYVQIMKRIREKGISFKEDERNRVNKLLATKLTVPKQKELEDRLNVLLSFRDITSSQGSTEKLEL